MASVVVIGGGIVGSDRVILLDLPVRATFKTRRPTSSVSSTPLILMQAAAE